ncbi:MAG: type I DNA topoisomerase [Chitinophagales bacterium]
MSKNLMIVESPAKAKTIEKFLGKDFLVKSCYGHIRDLEKSKMGIDLEKNYQPSYIISADKEDVVKELKKLASEAEEIWLATDEDREGEAISWHLCQVLGLDPGVAKRIVFHEITKNAIQKAVDNPRNIDQNLVNAQQARRILDRIVGFELSPLLWRKINLSKSLSAGRVQSVAVRLIVEREQEIMTFIPESSYKIQAVLSASVNGKRTNFRAELPGKTENEQDAEKFLQQCIGAGFSVKDIAVKPGKRTPSAPFTTSTLQQEASSKLGFSVSRTMVIAQKLYEEGHITYMRTDSMNLSEEALVNVQREIENRFGEKYSQQRRFKTKSSGAQEAHEAIRPTYMENEEISAGFDEQRLYKLIWRRTMASQMSDAILEKTTVNIEVSTRSEELVAKGEVIKFEGFLILNTEPVDEENTEMETDEAILPPLSIGQELQLEGMQATQKFTKASARFTEAALVKKLEELGIGRPSTYAPTISTVQKRGYVEKKDKDGVERKYIQFIINDKQVEKNILSEITGTEKSKLFPTDLGILVNEFLTKNFPKILDYNFTANVEGQFDEIAEGKVDWQKMIDGFYKPFHENLVDTQKNAEKVTGERFLGNHPESGEPVKVMMGRFGPMVVVGETLDPKEVKNNPDAKKPKFAGLLKSQNLHSISLEEALQLFQLPKTIGQYNDIDMVAGVGRFGPYIRYNNKFYSLPKGMEPLSVTVDEAIEVINAKDHKDANKTIHDWPEQEIQVLNGRFGPYIKKGKENFKIPKGKVAKELILEEVLEIIKNTQPTDKSKARSKRVKK